MEQEGFEQGLIALAYGMPESAYNILMMEQAEDEQYEFCSGMQKALKVWNLKKDGLNCRAIPHHE